MKKIYIIITSLTIIYLAFSCTNNLLDKTYLDRLSPATFYQNESEAKMALVGIYASLPPNSTPRHFYQLDFMSDNNFCQDSWQGSREFGEWLQNPSSWAAWAYWQEDYRTIVRVNYFLENIDKATMSDNVKKQMKAEAKFIRAIKYADLITFYGDVPLVLKTQTLAEANVTRTAKAVVLDSIMADLNAASPDLPLSYSGSDVGRATKGAALAYKAKTLLYNGKWDEAASAAKEVMDLLVYGLFDDYAGLFQETHENNQEVIFDIQYIKTTQSQPWPTSSTSLTIWPTANVTADLINSYYMTNGLPITNATSGYNDQDPYKDRDPRLAASVILPGSKMGSATFIPAGDGTPCGARPRKYADENNPDPGNCSLNTILMRYADILLMRAEALIESGNTGQEVYDLIDKVRGRLSVAMPKVEDVEGTGLGVDQLRQIVRHERRVEFFMEGTRYTDMLRWKDVSLIHDVYGYNKSKLTDPASAATWTFEQIKVETRVFDPAKGWLWPVPQGEIDVNPNLKPNNPGY